MPNQADNGSSSQSQSHSCRAAEAIAETIKLKKKQAQCATKTIILEIKFIDSVNERNGVCVCVSASVSLFPTPIRSLIPPSSCHRFWKSNTIHIYLMFRCFASPLLSLPYHVAIQCCVQHFQIAMVTKSIFQIDENDGSNGDGGGGTYIFYSI